MVMRIEHQGPSATMNHLDWRNQPRHTGQDTLGSIRIVHGRSGMAPMRYGTELQRYNEQGEISVILVDEPLLTGNLEQDISILNIVA